jgi:hypothetical protein
MKKLATILIAILSLTTLALGIENSAPSNDGFASASTLVMNGDTIVVTANNNDATKETGEPNHADNAGGKSVWFNFTPGATMYVRINVTQMSFDTLLAVYTGAGVNNLTFVGSNDDCSSGCGGASTVDLMLTAGQTYRIAVDGYNDGSATASGSFNLNILNFPAPYQDNFAAAYDLGVSNTGSIAGTNYNAGAEAGEPVHAGGFPATKSVWYRWTPSGNYSVDFELSENYQSIMSVYSATVPNPTFAQLHSVGYSYDALGYTPAKYRKTFFAESGKTYYISVDGHDHGNSAPNFGNFQLKFYPHRLRYSFRQSSIERTTIAVFRPGNGTWYSLPPFSSATYKNFGLNGDVPVPADFDGNDYTDYAVTRSENGKKIWYINESDSSLFYSVQWGLATDKEITGDFDRDGVADLGAIRQTPSGLVWYIRRSSDAAMQAFSWGVNTDKPVLGDFDGDGMTDVTVTRIENGRLIWYILKSGYGTANPTYSQMQVVQFGLNGDKMTAEDFDGDRRTDIAVFRPSSGTWYILRTTDGQMQVVQFGANGDIPQPGDYDGDGKAGVAVFRPSNGTWYTSTNPATNYGAVQWGTATDIPVASTSTLSQ